MEEIFTEAILFNESSIFGAIKKTSAIIDRLNSGEIKNVKDFFSNYLDELKSEAVRLDVCPCCGGKLRWNYIGNLNGDGLIGFVACVSCDFKEVEK